MFEDKYVTQLIQMQVPDIQLEMIVSQLREIKQSLPIFFSRLDPSHFFNLQQPSLVLPLTTVQNVVVLCVSAVGFANAFVQTIKKVIQLESTILFGAE